jgi:hypothetical protein
VAPLSCELYLNSCDLCRHHDERKAKRTALDKIRKLTPSDPLPLPFFALLVSQSMTMAGRIRSGDAVLEIFFNMLQGHDPNTRTWCWWCSWCWWNRRSIHKMRSMKE